jgi:hypothetical protein
VPTQPTVDVQLWLVQSGWEGCSLVACQGIQQSYVINLVMGGMLTRNMSGHSTVVRNQSCAGSAVPVGPAQVIRSPHMPLPMAANVSSYSHHQATCTSHTVQYRLIITLPAIYVFGVQTRTMAAAATFSMLFNAHCSTGWLIAVACGCGLLAVACWLWLFLSRMGCPVARRGRQPAPSLTGHCPLTAWCS